MMKPSQMRSRFNNSRSSNMTVVVPNKELKDSKGRRLSRDEGTKVMYKYQEMYPTAYIIEEKQASIMRKKHNVKEKRKRMK